MMLLDKYIFITHENKLCLNVKLVAGIYTHSFRFPYQSSHVIFLYEVSNTQSFHSHKSTHNSLHYGPWSHGTLSAVFATVGRFFHKTEMRFT